MELNVVNSAVFYLFFEILIKADRKTNEWFPSFQLKAVNEA